MLGSDDFITEIGKQPLKSMPQEPPMTTPYPKMVEQTQNTTMAQQIASIIQTQHSVLKPSDNEYIPTTQTRKEIEKATKNAITKEVSIPSDLPIKERIGKKGLMWPRTYAVNHPAAPFLQTYALNGCPVDCGDQWTRDRIEAAIEHGPHRSARTPAARQALRDETQNKVQQGFAKIVQYKDIAKNLPPQLKISPAACIPHKSRKFRVILDLSFRFFFNGAYKASVNDTTVPQAPVRSMGQLGTCFRRLIATMATNCDQNFPFRFSKLDVKDGFWRMVVSPSAAWNFCYVLPTANGKTVPLEDTELVVPDALQMGWCESPPFFCTASETARDVIQELLNNNTQLPQHKYEHMLLPNTLPPTVPLKPATVLEVFVDDFIAGTNQLEESHLQQLSRCMLHGVHAIFPPSEVTQHGGGDSIAKNKLDKEDGRWTEEKEILGWTVNGAQFTIQLPADKVTKVLQRLSKIKKFKRKIPRKALDQLAGSLEHASFGIPGGAGLFSPIQQGLVGNKQWIKVKPDLTQCFQDWGAIIKYMASNPTHVLQLVKGLPHYVGFSDSCGIGTGGVWSSGTTFIVPVLWSLKWPPDIQALFRDGKLTINDLELAGMVIHWIVLECLAQTLQFKHAALFCDNSSAVSWAHKLRSSVSLIAGRLLRFLGVRIHARQASHITSLSIQGDDNIMADVVSRAFHDGKYFSAEHNLTNYFNLHFPLPQSISWEEFTPPPKLTQRVMSLLRGEQLTMGSLLRLPRTEKSTGKRGFNTHASGKLTPTFKPATASTQSSSSQLLLQGSGRASSAGDFKSKFRPLLRHSQPSQRPSVWLDNPVPSKRLKMSLSSQSKGSSKDYGEKTHRQSPN